MTRSEFDCLLTATLPTIERAVLFFAKRYDMLDEWRDVTQDVILRLLTYCEQYDPLKGTIRQWSVSMIRNCFIERFSERAAAPSMTDCNDISLWHVPSASDIYSDMQVSFILDNINRETRLYYEGYNLAEIAEASGLRGRNSAKWRIDVCAHRLAAMLGYDGALGRRERIVKKKSGKNFGFSS